ncbi:MAG: Phosphoglycerate kinase [Chlamydiae bacterium]|nr:Phosphoglycerate kinase [Chlamydiota bacterium]
MNLKNLPIEGKKVLVRVDFNVPFDSEGNISDDTRIRAALPTIQYILGKGASVILMSHLGRPKGKIDPKLSLAPCAKRLSELLDQKVQMAPDCIGEKVEKMAAALKNGEALLLENLRFYIAEEKPDTDPSFAENLAKLADFYVNDAFGTAHRAHSSTAAIVGYFSEKAAPGLLLQKEIDFLGTHFSNPKHPFYAIIGGAKVSSKLGVLQSLLEKVDGLFIGGGMAYTFFKAAGLEIGDSLCEDELLPKAKEFLEIAKKKKVPIFLPKDLVIANVFSNDAEKRIILSEAGIPKGWQGLDIGPITRTEWANTLKNAQMIFWNGPLGVFEFPNFAEGTHSMANTLAASDAVTIVGGGDSAFAINQLDLAEKFTHISTGGGACLEYIQYGHLPGIDAILKN